MELDDSKATCLFELTTRVFSEITNLRATEDLEKRRVAAITVVGKIKDCFNRYWEYLSDVQKEKVCSL